MNTQNHGVTFSHGHLHENKQSIINRLSRAIGHLEKIFFRAAKMSHLPVPIQVTNLFVDAEDVTE